jgi:tRNA threonylcarbamoyladenosine biosynthesis protein TsaB
MRILALETADRAGSVAALVADQLLFETQLPAVGGSARTLAPALAELLAKVGWRPADVKLVAVARGPGSFTGLRVGVTAAKVFAYAVGAEVLGINTLEAIAERAPREPAEARQAAALRVAIDAQRQQVFCATFRCGTVGELVEVEPVSIADEIAWLSSLKVGDAATGTALERLSPRIPAGVELVDKSLWAPTAAAVGRVAWRRYLTGERHDLWSLLPDYFRPSAAEEKAAT